MSISFHPDEKIIKTFRRWALLYFWHYFFVILFIVTPFFFMFVLFSWGNWGMGIFSASLVVGIFLLLRVLYFQRRNSLIITNRRVICVEQKGLLNQIVADLVYADISNVSYQIKGIGPTIFRYGTVKIKTTGHVEDLYFHGLKRPSAVNDAISRVKVETSGFKNSAPLNSKDNIPNLLNAIKKLTNEEIDILRQAMDDLGKKE